MANWIEPQFSRSAVNKAGKVLGVSDSTEVELNEALGIINNWRASHSYPLHILKKNLNDRVKRIDENAVVAQRLKRLSSIDSKLSRNPNMKLSQMQDIGGCRAVLSSVEKVRELAVIYDQAVKKASKARSERIEIYDYIECPKSDGYRSLHYVL
jgi:ppGpp synthetase/RelA/SpoT-type nucleotidyltranferase